MFIFCRIFNTYIPSNKHAIVFILRSIHFCEISSVSLAPICASLNHQKKFRHKGVKFKLCWPWLEELQIVQNYYALLKGKEDSMWLCSLLNCFLALARCRINSYFFPISSLPFTGQKYFPKSDTLRRLGGLCVSVTSRAMLAGDSFPGRVTRARQIER